MLIIQSIVTIFCTAYNRKFSPSNGIIVTLEGNRNLPFVTEIFPLLWFCLWNGAN